ncbi:MAG: nuclear transport factor 2 family protein [Alphaproteobacteria bacterium]
MTNREKIREAYRDGWREMDPEKLIATLAPGFIFDDPIVPEPITKDTIAHHMAFWNEKAKDLSVEWNYVLSDEVQEDKDGVLMRWGWWKVTGTNLEGSRVEKVTDEGVVFERIAYYTAPPS